MSEAKPTSRKVRILGYGLTIAIPVAFVALLECSGYLYLKWRGDDTHRLFLRDGDAGRMGGVLDTRERFSFLDPHLSHAHDPAGILALGFETIPGFAVSGATDDEDAFTVVALGGSTTDPVLGRTWTLYLSERLAREGIHARVLNGGVSGHSSNQELFKLIRDVLPLGPDLVISLNGVNDFGFLHSTANYPMVHPYQKKVLSAVAGQPELSFPLLPNAVGAAMTIFDSQPEIGVHLGTPVKRRDHEQWHANVRTMHAAAAEFGIPYRCFLQPILGIGVYDLSAEETVMLEEAAAFHRHRKDYLALMESFYTEARKRAADTPYIIDLTDVFDGKAGMYSDSRHQTPEGSEVIANAIFEHCKATGLLDGARQEGAAAP